MSAIKTKRDKPTIVVNGHVFTHDAYSADKTKEFMKCDRRGGCKARIHVSMEIKDDGTREILREMGEHNHDRSLMRYYFSIVVKFKFG
jgi:hypothetical protein